MARHEEGKLQVFHKVRFSVVVYLSIIILGLVGCKKTSHSAANKTSASSDSPLIFARSADSVGLDVASHDDGEAINIAVNIFETLVHFKTGTTEIEPQLASEWTISKDGKTYNFKLRPNVVFHDQTPMNADAVVFSFERQMNKNHPAYQSGAPYKYWENMAMSTIIESVKKVNDLEVEIKLKQPNAPFLANLAMPFLSIVSPTAVLNLKRDFDRKPVGTGPYVLKSWKKDDAMELQAFDHYWGKPPAIKRVIVRTIPDNSVRLLELKRGTVHIMENPNPADLAQIANDPNITVLKQEGLNVGYLSFNMKKPPLDKLEVRQALSLTIDRQRLIDEIFMGLGKLAKNPMPPQVLGYADQVPEIEYNPEKAKALLAKAGIKNLKLSLWALPVARPYNPNGRKMAEFIQADLKRIGVETTIVSYDWGTYLDKVGKGEHEIGMHGWNGDNGDADNFLFTLWSADAARQSPSNNYSFYINDEMTKWLRMAQVETNTAKRNKLYEKVQIQMAKDRVFLPIAHSMNVVPVRKEIEGYKIHPMGDRRFFEARFHDSKMEAQR